MESSHIHSDTGERHSPSFSHQIHPQTLDDEIESEAVSQAGDIGDRQISSNRYSRSGSLQYSGDDVMNVEDGVVCDNNVFSTSSPVFLVPSDVVSPLSTVSMLFSTEKNQTLSGQLLKENQSEWPRLLEYISCLLHLAVFGILGVFTRYFLQKLFGPTVAGITSNQSVLYLDLPSNVVGSFLMGWLGVVFKGDICQVSDLLAIGLTTGYLGSLTTFSGWNQKMLDLSVKGQWVTAVLGFLVGLWIVAESLRTGVETAKGFRFLLKRFTMNSESVKPNPRWNYRVDGFKQHLMVMVMMVLLLGFLWGVSGTLLRKRLYDGNSNAQLWLACIVAPPGVWARWFFARFNGRGLGKKGVLKWIPFGTLLVNVSAASVMAALSTVKKEVNTKKCDIIVTGIQFGLLGCLSTVSTFIAEYHAMRESKYPWRAHAYAAITILPSFIIGTLIYSIPVWTKVHH